MTSIFGRRKKEKERDLMRLLPCASQAAHTRRLLALLKIPGCTAVWMRCYVAHDNTGVIRNFGFPYPRKLKRQSRGI